MSTYVAGCLTDADVRSEKSDGVDVICIRLMFYSVCWVMNEESREIEVNHEVDALLVVCTLELLSWVLAGAVVRLFFDLPNVPPLSMQCSPGRPRFSIIIAVCFAIVVLL